MKKRLSRVLNFFAFNLLFFALYLNFIHKDNNTAETAVPHAGQAASSETVLVSNPEQYIHKDAQQAQMPQSVSLRN